VHVIVSLLQAEVEEALFDESDIKAATVPGTQVSTPILVS
jgi:hypothetical protein